MNTNIKFFGKFRYRIELDTYDDVKELVATATKCDGKILVKSGNGFSVNAKSLLGVILAKNLNWDDLVLEMEHDYYNNFKKFIVE